MYLWDHIDDADTLSALIIGNDMCSSYTALLGLTNNHKREQVCFGDLKEMAGGSKKDREEKVSDQENSNNKKNERRFTRGRGRSHQVTKYSKTRSESAPVRLSPNRFQVLEGDSETDDDDQPWECVKCEEVFHEENAKLLECMKCERHYCIKCGKKPDQYELMKDPDIMWFCEACREKVEKALDIDRKIEEKCKEISDLYESRIRKLEDEMKVSRERRGEDDC